MCSSTLEALHKSRLLNVEEKPFRRLTKRLLTEPSALYLLSKTRQLPTPPAEASEEDATSDDQIVVDTRTPDEKASAERLQFREDVILDFAAFEGSILRNQCLRQSNAKERERYAAEKIQIEATAKNVRDSTTRLRVQLDEAQKTLAVRKTYDELAEKITNDKALKPRDEQHLNLEKLRAEIEDLERESREHDLAWRERREQFARMSDESARLRRLIRDEKEEIAQPESEDLLDVEHARGGRSNIGTPRPEEGGLTPMHHTQGGSGPMTPSSRRVTPQPEENGTNATAEKPVDHISETLEDGDAEMADEGEVGDSTPQVGGKSTNGQPLSQPSAVKVEGEPEQMDTS
jgi:Tho complex subunit 7